MLHHTAHTRTRLAASALPRHCRRGYEGTGDAAAAKGVHGNGFTIHVEEGASHRADYRVWCPRAHPADETREHRPLNRGAKSLAAP